MLYVSCGRYPGTAPGDQGPLALHEYTESGLKVRNILETTYDQ